MKFGNNFLNDDEEMKDEEQPKSKTAKKVSSLITDKKTWLMKYTEGLKAEDEAIKRFKRFFTGGEENIDTVKKSGSVVDNRFIATMLYNEGFNSEAIEKKIIDTISLKCNENEEEEVVNDLKAKFNSHEWRDIMALMNTAKENQQAVLKSPLSKDFKPYKDSPVRRLIIFIGNTGSGKTTMAKYITKLYDEACGRDNGEWATSKIGGSAEITADDIVKNVDFEDGKVVYMSTLFREKMRNGGCVFIDEGNLLNKKVQQFLQCITDDDGSIDLRQTEDEKKDYGKDKKEYKNSKFIINKNFRVIMAFNHYTEDGKKGLTNALIDRNLTVVNFDEFGENNEKIKRSQITSKKHFISLDDVEVAERTGNEDEIFDKIVKESKETEANLEKVSGDGSLEEFIKVEKSVKHNFETNNCFSPIRADIEKVKNEHQKDLAKKKAKVNLDEKDDR